VGLDGDDAELGGRHLAFWQALLDRFGNDPDALARPFGGAEEHVDGAAEASGAILRALAALPSFERDLAVLPVVQVGAGGEELYELREEGRALLASLVDPSASSETRVRVQVLNGNGAPGIGARAGEALVESGFRIVLSGNAGRLDYAETLVIAHDSSPEGIDAARRARDLLGVGRVQVAAEPQGIVDVTVVIGKDFLRGDR
jgi:hypothetical protein